ncbi:MAG: hypothetical protein U0941_22665 [Planctomycetaceae bacterium]
MKSFLQQMSSKIKGALSGLDRVRFRGTIRWLSSLRGMGSYMGTMKILLKDFKKWGKARTAEIEAATRAAGHRSEAAGNLSTQQYCAKRDAGYGHRL